MKVVIDTNVLISALGWEGNPRYILNQIIENKIQLLSSPEQLNELKAVLNKDKLKKIPAEDRKEFLLLISEISTIISPSIKLNIARDEKDNMILELAKVGLANFIITGNKDLLYLKYIDGIKIISPIDFIRSRK